MFCIYVTGHKDLQAHISQGFLNSLISFIRPEQRKSFIIKFLTVNKHLNPFQSPFLPPLSLSVPLASGCTVCESVVVLLLLYKLNQELRRQKHGGDFLELFVSLFVPPVSVPDAAAATTPSHRRKGPHDRIKLHSFIFVCRRGSGVTTEVSALLK